MFTIKMGEKGNTSFVLSELEVTPITKITETLVVGFWA